MNARYRMRPIAVVFIIAACLGPTALPAVANVRVYGARFDLPIPIDLQTGKGWMPDATITIEDHHIISDLDVALSLTHSSVFDLQIFLQSPKGTTVLLNMYDYHQFFTGADYTKTLFDDQATVPIEQGSPPFTGRFIPKGGNALQAFNNQDAYGSWHLRIYDAFEGDTGTLNNFQLIVTTPEPTSLVILTTGAAALIMFRPRRRY